MGGDGIVLDTAIDASGFQEGTQRLENAIRSFASRAKTSMGNIAKSSKGVLNTIRKWGPSLLGIGGAYQIISRATNAFLAQNQQLSGQLSSVWTALGNVLGPVITQLVNWITTVVSYFLTFLRLLGVTSKSASQLSKAGKEAGGGAAALKKSLLGFDELNLLQDNSGGGGGGGGGAGLPDLDPPAWMQKLVDIIKSKEWRELGEFISDAIISGLNKIADFIYKIPWKEIGFAIAEFFRGIKWEEIADAIFGVLKAAWHGAIQLLWGLLADPNNPDAKPPIIAALENIGKAFEELYKGVKVVVKQLLEILAELFGVAVNDILPVVINLLAEAIKKLGEFLQRHGELIKAVLSAIIGWLIGKGIASGILKTVAAFKKICDVMKLVGGALKVLGGLIAAHPIAAIIIGIITALVLLYRHSEKFRNWVNEIGNYIKELFGKFVEFFNMLRTDPAEAFGMLGQSILDSLKGSLQGGLFAELKILFYDPFVRIIDAIKGFFGISSSSSLMVEIGTSIVQGLMTGLDTLWELLTTWLIRLWESITKKFDALMQKASQTGLNIVNNIMNGLNSIWGSLTGWLSGIYSTISNTFNNLISNALAWGRHLIQNIIRGISSSFPSLRSTVSEGASIVHGFWGHSKPKEGPLRDDDRWGYHMVDNFIDGIEGSMPKMKSAVSKLAEAAVISDFGSFEGGNGIVSRLSDIANTVSYAKPNLASGNVLPYSLSGSNYASSGTEAGSSVGLSDIVNSIEGLKAMMGSLDENNNRSFSFNVYLDGRQLEAVVTRRQERTLKAKGLA